MNFLATCASKVSHGFGLPLHFEYVNSANIEYLICTEQCVRYWEYWETSCNNYLHIVYHLAGKTDVEQVIIRPLIIMKSRMLSKCVWKVRKGFCWYNI